MNLSKSVKVGFIIIPLIYFVTTIISFYSFSKKDDTSTAEKFRIHKHITINQLKSLYDAEEFDCNQSKIFSKTVLLDSTLIGFYKEKNSFIIKAKINSNCDGKYFARLSCSKNIYERVTKTKNNHLIIAAKINRIENNKYELDFDSLDQSENFSMSENNFLLNGECLTFVEMKY